MGGLPYVELPRDVVAVGDEKVEIRCLTRAQALRLRTMKDDMDAAERFIIAAGAGVTEDEAQAWREAAPSDVVGEIIERIVDLSGLSEEASKSDGPGANAGDD